MLVVALTGGIGSGKSTVANLFAAYGITIIDADAIAYSLTQAGQPALSNIVDHYGKELLLDNNNLDRKKLRHIIFSNAAERHWLQDLLHPLIRAEIEARLSKIHTPHPYCIVVIPLLFEVTPYPFIDRILVVDASESAQIERVMLRDYASSTEIKDILQTQITREQRLAQADDIIINDGLLADLELQVAKLHQKYLLMNKLSSN